MFQSFLISLVGCWWPFWITFSCCIYYGYKKWAQSRIAAVTDTQLIKSEGYYSLCCICWNSKIKSVPLNKITDLNLEQGCLQRINDIQELKIQTASSGGKDNENKPEMQLIGLINPMKQRKKVIQLRDAANNNSQYKNNVDKINPITSNPEIANGVQLQNDEMNEIRDLLVDMRSAIVSMESKMQ